MSKKDSFSELQRPLGLRSVFGRSSRSVCVHWLSDSSVNIRLDLEKASVWCELTPGRSRVSREDIIHYSCYPTYVDERHRLDDNSQLRIALAFKLAGHEQKHRLGASPRVEGERESM